MLVFMSRCDSIFVFMLEIRFYWRFKFNIFITMLFTINHINFLSFKIHFKIKDEIKLYYYVIILIERFAKLIISPSTFSMKTVRITFTITTINFNALFYNKKHNYSLNNTMIIFNKYYWIYYKQNNQLLILFFQYLQILLIII